MQTYNALLQGIFSHNTKMTALTSIIYIQSYYKFCVKSKPHLCTGTAEDKPAEDLVRNNGILVDDDVHELELVGPALEVEEDGGVAVDEAGLANDRHLQLGGLIDDLAGHLHLQQAKKSGFGKFFFYKRLKGLLHQIVSVSFL